MALIIKRRRLGGQMRRELTAKGFNLNLTSMVDMFCIILVFLLVSHSVADVALSPPKGVTLPTSNSRTLPDILVKLSISPEEISIEDRPVVRLKQGRLNGEDLQGMVIYPLFRELKSLSVNKPTQGKDDGAAKVERKIILQGDQTIPFETLERVLFTAGQAEYEGFRFAVMQKESVIK